MLKRDVRDGDVDLGVSSQSYTVTNALKEKMGRKKEKVGKEALG